jgi:hypothetical protein
VYQLLGKYADAEGLLQRALAIREKALGANHPDVAASLDNLATVPVADHESHALWRIFCGPSEGVAVQTTVGKLRGALNDIPVYPVIYGEPPKNTPQQIVQATMKRPAFSYEQEVRIIATRDTTHPNLIKGEFGFEFPLDMNIINCVAVHPEADGSFKETVTRTVDDYAPALRDRVEWSSMREKPPFR